MDDGFIYDIFIAYHGTASPDGSYAQAKKIADFLRKRDFSVYLHNYAYSSQYPLHRDTQWNTTWERVKEARTFLLVVNDFVPRKSNKTLGDDVSMRSQLRLETDTFLEQVTSGKRNIHDFNWYYCGKKTGREEQQEFLTELYSVLSNGHNELLLGTFGEQAVENWLLRRLGKERSVPAERAVYTSPLSRPFLKVVEAASFSDAYMRTRDVVKDESNGVIVSLELDAASLQEEFPFATALKQAETIRGRTPSSGNIQFSLYHGDYIIGSDGDKEINGYRYIISELKRKPTSRRAIISLINGSQIVGTRNLPIPSYMLTQVQLRGENLVMEEYFRAMEISGFFQINLGEAYLLIREILKEFPDIRKIFLTFLIFDAYVSNQPQSSLYIPKMDRDDAQYDIIEAVGAKDYAALVAMLDDKLACKIYDRWSGFELINKSFARKGYPEQEVKSRLERVIGLSKELNDKGEKTNLPQDELIRRIEEELRALRQCFMKLGGQHDD